MNERPVQLKGSNHSRAKAVLKAAGPGAAVIGCVLLLALLQHVSRGLDYHAVVHAVRYASSKLILASILLTAVSYVALAARDLSALSYVGVKVSTAAMLLASFCGSALGNAVGLRALTADAARERVYGAAGVEPEQTERVLLFTNVAFGIGLVVFFGGCLMLAGSAMARVVPMPIAWIRCVGAFVFLTAVAVITLQARRHQPVTLGRLSFEMPTPTNAAIHFIATLADLTAAAAALWILLPHGGVDFFSFAAIFSTATALGVISRIPGGLGVFDVTVLLALRGIVPADEIAAALLIYRGTYFIAPLVVAAAMLAGVELKSETGRFGSKAAERLSVGAGLLAPIFLSVVTFAVGVMLIVSGATPALDWRLALLQQVLPLWAVEISHLLATLAGVFLLFVARGLYHRLDGAWWLALILALANIVLSLAKGLAFGETAVAVFLVLLLLATRREFTRPAAFMHQPFRIGWFLTIAVVIAGAVGILMFAFRDVAYRHEMWLQFEFDAQASRSLRAILGASIFALGISLWQFMQTAPGRVRPPSAQDLSRAAEIIAGQSRSAPMLALMGDKSFMFSKSGNSFLMYAKRGRSWVALFDPVGTRDEWPELVWRFVETADEHGGRAAFYQVHPDNLPLYLDAGLRVVKVGEEACINLREFGMEGPERYGLRQALKRAEREGLALQVLSPDRVCQQQGVLNEISRTWLSNHSAAERRFSVAAFEPRFIAAQSAALACLNGRPQAFVTFMTTDLGYEATIGLMRQVPYAPAYTMEFMFTQLALELKARGFAMLSLGMAPLAGIARTPAASQWHRIASLLWEHGGAIYNFRGLRSFKNKFRPVWEPRYLAASGAIGPFISLADVAALANSHRRRSSSAA